MSQTILPCPTCGGRAVYYDNPDVPARNYVGCENLDCSVCGPFGEDETEAIEKWNSLPRKLTWSHEPPTVPGYYWLHAPSTDRTSICEVKEQNGAMCFRLLYDWHGITILPKDAKWSGPIPMPEDAK